MQGVSWEWTAKNVMDGWNRGIILLSSIQKQANQSKNKKLNSLKIISRKSLIIVTSHKLTKWEESLTINLKMVTKEHLFSKMTVVLNTQRELRQSLLIWKAINLMTAVRIKKQQRTMPNLFHLQIFPFCRTKTISGSRVKKI